MSIFEVFSQRKKIQGKIAVNPNNNYGYFSMQSWEVKKRCSGMLGSINHNLQLKNIHGELHFCRFKNHDGTTF